MFQTDFKGYANDYELQIVKITVLTIVIQFPVVVVVVVLPKNQLNLVCLQTVSAEDSVVDPNLEAVFVSCQ